MLRAATLLLFVVIFFSGRAIAQQADIPWLSLKRLAVTASGSYHYSPWKKYNESMTLAQDAVRYDPYYQNPRGGFEKILGDASFDLTALYRVISGFSFGIRAGLLTTGGTAVLTYNVAKNIYAMTFPSDMTKTIEQKMQLGVPHYGVALQYALGLTESLRLCASAYVSRYLGSFSFDYRNEIRGGRSLYSADLREGRFGLTCGMDLHCRAYGPLSIVASLEYRWLRFPNLTGNGMYRYEPSDQYTTIYTQTFEAQLGEADGYFGLLFKNHPSGPSVHGLWERTPSRPWWIMQKPAVLDISGIGVSLGVQYAF